jgi:hypothetical protein
MQSVVVALALVTPQFDVKLHRPAAAPPRAVVPQALLPKAIIPFLFIPTCEMCTTHCSSRVFADVLFAARAIDQTSKSATLWRPNSATAKVHSHGSSNPTLCKNRADRCVA